MRRSEEVRERKRETSPVVLQKLRKESMSRIKQWSTAIDSEQELYKIMSKACPLLGTASSKETFMTLKYTKRYSILLTLAFI